MLAFCQDALGYAYLGNWKDRPDNGNVEEALLTGWLRRQGHSDKTIRKFLFELGMAAAPGGSKTLYDANREVYGLLRYGVKVRPDVGEQTVTVWLIDWANAEANDFAVAEEVTVAGEELLVCSLIHKFGASEEDDLDAFLDDIQKHLPKDFYAKGDLFVFVDECHRTQSGKLHQAMKALLPDAMLIGFTGTPLLKSDKRRSIETFGPYIHTYRRRGWTSGST